MAKTAPVPEEQKFNPGDLDSFRFATDIDRRKCNRVVPMKVLGLGLSRTGTASMRQALIDLGYKDCYHFAAPLQENPPDQDMWIEALEAKFEGKGKPFQRTDWDQLLGHCQATTDNPANIFYKELLEAYPDTKVVVTIRDNAEQWQQSYNATIGPFFDTFITPQSMLRRLFQIFMPMDARTVRLSRLMVKHAPIMRTLQDDYLLGTTAAQTLYHGWLDELKRIVPEERLLIMNVKEGWKPLCDFLGEEVPLYPFPRKNDTAVFEQNNATLGAIMYRAAMQKLLSNVGAIAIGVVAIGFVVQRYRIR